jgi:hypothetical protein
VVGVWDVLWEGAVVSSNPHEYVLWELWEVLLSTSTTCTLLRQKRVGALWEPPTPTLSPTIPFVFLQSGAINFTENALSVGIY